jgi:hypothetical protein
LGSSEVPNETIRRRSPEDSTVSSRASEEEPFLRSEVGVRRQEEFPHIVEVEQAPKEAAVLDQRIKRGKERDGGRRLRRRFQQRDVLADDEAFAAYALDVDGNELAQLDQLLAEGGRPGDVDFSGSDFTGVSIFELSRLMGRVGQGDRPHLRPPRSRLPRTPSWPAWRRGPGVPVLR